MRPLPATGSSVNRSPNPAHRSPPYITPGTSRYSWCRSHDSWIELDAEPQDQTKDDPAEHDQQRDSGDLDQRGLQSLSGFVSARDRPPVDIDCAHTGPNEWDERQ